MFRNCFRTGIAELAIALELESGFPSRRGQSRYPTVIQVTGTVKHNRRDSHFKSPLRNRGSHKLRRGDIAAGSLELRLDVRLHSAGLNHRVPLGIVDNLGIDVVIAPENAQTGP